MWMAWKCAIAKIPCGGAEGGGVFDVKQMSPRELERMTGRWAIDDLPSIVASGQAMGKGRIAIHHAVRRRGGNAL
jgi:hypothetical protein